MIEHYFSQMIDTFRGGGRGAQDRRSRRQRGRLPDGHAVALEAEELVLRVLDHLGVRRVQRPSLHVVAAFMSTNNSITGPNQTAHFDQVIKLVHFLAPSGRNHLQLVLPIFLDPPFLDPPTPPFNVYLLLSVGVVRARAELDDDDHAVRHALAHMPFLLSCVR